MSQLMPEIKHMTYKPLIPFAEQFYLEMVKAYWLSPVGPAGHVLRTPEGAHEFAQRHLDLYETACQEKAQS